MSQLAKSLSKLLADTYALYLKTQNYHWHVHGPQFKTLHILFEEQYTTLAQAVDDIAERILTLGEKAPATFDEYNQLKSIPDGDSNANAAKMVSDLYDDHGKLIKDLNQSIRLAQDSNDEGSISLLSERIAAHEKIRWMLGASK